MLLDGAADPAAVLDSVTDDRRLSRSFLRGCLVLSALPRDGTPLGVVDLAKSIGASPSTTHRYLLTLVELGLVEYVERTRRYCLATAVLRDQAGEPTDSPALSGSA
jgi:hypothetical protein